MSDLIQYVEARRKILNERVSCHIFQVEGGFNVTVGSNMCNLASSRKPYEPKVFKRLDGAVNACCELGCRSFRVTMSKPRGTRDEYRN